MDFINLLVGIKVETIEKRASHQTTASEREQSGSAEEGASAQRIARPHEPAGSE